MADHSYFKGKRRAYSFMRKSYSNMLIAMYKKYGTVASARDVLQPILKAKRGENTTGVTVAMGEKHTVKVDRSKPTMLVSASKNQFGK